MKIAKLVGTVFSGGGEGKRFLDLPWVKRQVKQQLGFIPYSGTLNVMLSEESAKRRKVLENASSLRFCPPEGYCNGALFKALIGTLKCAVVIPEVVGYPKDILEIIAAINLRERFQLENGNEVTVIVIL